MSICGTQRNNATTIIIIIQRLCLLICCRQDKITKKQVKWQIQGLIQCMLHTSTRKGTVLPREKKKKKKIPLFWSPSWLVSMSNCSVLSWVFKMNYYYYSPRKFTCSGWVVWSLGIKHRPTGHALQINCTHSDYAASFSLSFALTSPAILCVIFPHPAYLTEWWARLNKSHHHHHYPQLWLLLLWLAMDDDTVVDAADVMSFCQCTWYLSVKCKFFSPSDDN